MLYCVFLVFILILICWGYFDVLLLIIKCSVILLFLFGIFYIVDLFFIIVVVFLNIFCNIGKGILIIWVFLGGIDKLYFVVLFFFLCDVRLFWVLDIEVEKKFFFRVFFWGLFILKKFFFLILRWENLLVNLYFFLLIIVKNCFWCCCFILVLMCFIVGGSLVVFFLYFELFLVFMRWFIYLLVFWVYIFGGKFSLYIEWMLVV